MGDQPQGRSPADREGRAYARWAAAPVLSAGFLAPVPFFVAASRTRQRRYLRAAAFWTLMVIACIVCLAISGDHSGTWQTLGGFLIFINVGGASAHTLWIRQDVGRQLALAADPQLTAAERRVDMRERAREIARADPKRALELGVGRPDIDGAFDGDLIDINHAPLAALEQLPGIDAERARRIVELRMNGTGFVSADELDMVLDLEPGIVSELAARTVFLPRD